MREWLEKLLLAAVAALAPIHAVIITVGILVIADLITGVWAAMKRGENVNSASMRRTVSKMVIYQIAVVSGFLVEQYLIAGLLPITKIVAGVIGLVEFKSILENANSIAGDNLFKIILQRLGSENDLKKIIEQKSEPKE